ncbi:hypothetical protein AB0L13_25580 [Saccharopolyspora shandongensis]|uniref:hypothetical protein n=1 Tax=Saccharopolyspora shandongensis TaxID=418495 RepID=UPI003445BA28
MFEQMIHGPVVLKATGHVGVETMLRFIAHKFHDLQHGRNLLDQKALGARVSHTGS